MVKLFRKNSNLCDHNPPTSQTDRRHAIPAWSCPLKRAVYSTPDSQCLECYIYRLSTLDTMQKIGVWDLVVM